jgi:uncharacterized damage-inducible protein DinB
MPVGQPLDLGRELFEAFEHSCRVTEYVVGVLPSRVWRPEPADSQGRSIAAIVAHLQSVRRMFAKTGGARPIPPALDRARSTPDDARRGLRESREALMTLFREALTQGRPRVKGMPRRTVNMMIYLIQHDAHHRGQICALARALGHRLSKDDVMRIWGWKRLTPS